MIVICGRQKIKKAKTTVSKNDEAYFKILLEKQRRQFSKYLLCPKKKISRKVATAKQEYANIVR
jgi:hypothetical protein